MAVLMGASGPINLDPFTPEQEGNKWSSQAEADTFHQECDQRFGEIYMKKLTALGYEATLKKAIEIYKDPIESQRIDDEYHQLQVRKTMDGALGSIESILRRLNKE